MKSSLTAAKAALRSEGFEIVGEKIPVRVGGHEVSDVDLLARKFNNLYAVEVKSGRLDVGGVRQAYVNALLLKAIPMVVCRGFSDPSARALAEELGVHVIELEDLLISDPEELRAMIREEVRSAMMEVLPGILRPPQLSEDDVKVLRAISESMDFLDASERLKLQPEEFGRVLGKMRKEGKLPRWTRDYSQVRAWACTLLRFLEG